jgi:hypothetical protein
MGKVNARGNIMSKKSGIVGISDHGGWAVLVTAAGDGTLLDRRRVEFVDEGLPKLPHDNEGQALPLDEGRAGGVSMPPVSLEGVTDTRHGFPCSPLR